MIELRGVSKRFGLNVAVRNLSFKCREKEFVVIFGPAGAGKSTTLRMVAGITEPTYGELYINDKLLKGVPPEKRNMSMVFENYALYSHLTSFENLAFPLRARKIPENEIKKQVAKMAEILQIGELLDRKPGFLSGGQRQRVALGRSLVRQADVYLLDEPISHLDARLRILMRAELKNICHEKNALVLHVTHDYREAMALADRVIVLNKGRIMQDAAPEEVYNNPANTFVARFIGDPPMSFITVNLVSENDRFAFVVEGTQAVIPVANDFNKDVAVLAGAAGELKVGLRANKTSITFSPDEQHNVPSVIYLVESQGHRNLVTVKLGDDLVQVVTSPKRKFKVGEQVWVSLHSDFLHVFADGRAIYHPTISH